MADRLKKKGSRSAWVFLRPVGMKAAVSLLFASLVLFALLAGWLVAARELALNALSPQKKKA